MNRKRNIRKEKAKKKQTNKKGKNKKEIKKKKKEEQNKIIQKYPLLCVLKLPKQIDSSLAQIDFDLNEIPSDKDKTKEI